MVILTLKQIFRSVSICNEVNIWNLRLKMEYWKSTLEIETI